MSATLSLSKSARAWLESYETIKWREAWDACEYVSNFPSGHSLVNLPDEVAAQLRDRLPANLRPACAVSHSHAKPWPIRPELDEDEAPQFSFVSEIR